MRLSLFVNSRGTGPSDDYGWVSEAGPEAPPVLGEQSPDGQGVADLVQFEADSTALIRSGDRYWLLKTGLRLEAADFQGRRIRASLAVGLARNTDERHARSLAAAALGGNLSAEVRGAVSVQADGFTVDWSRLRESCEAAASYDPIGSRLPTAVPSVAQSSPRAIGALIDDLKTCALPTGVPFLVVATGKRSQERMRAAGVWRALVDLPPASLAVQKKKSPGLRFQALGPLVGLAVLVVLALLSRTCSAPTETVRPLPPGRVDSGPQRSNPTPESAPLRIPPQAPPSLPPPESGPPLVTVPEVSTQSPAVMEPATPNPALAQPPPEAPP